MDSLCIDREKQNHIWLKDPWLIEKSSDSSNLPVNFLASYPSPEKIQASNLAHADYNEFKSDLFTAGVLGLQLHAMNFRDDLYSQKRFVDRVKLNHSLALVREERLRGGLAILLNENPDHRLQIFQYWDIQCGRDYCLGH